MSNYDGLIDKISKLTGTVFRAASDDDLSALRTLRLPQAIIDFYARHEPSNCAEGQVRLWPISDIVVENSDAVPGAYTSPHGYVVFASTFCGDAYCFDINMTSDDDPRIVLISHEEVSDEISADQARRFAKPVATNLREFLEKFISSELDEECVYPPST